MTGGRPTSAYRYLCIDLKSFYASVECVDRGLNPLTTNLVVADPTRTDKTICLAVSPSMKALGVRNRCRVFEIPRGIKYTMAPPRMRRYIERSADVYGIYLHWLAKEDIHVYSVDEAFMDVGPYLDLYGMGARELGERIREDVVAQTGIPATCGLGTNLYLAKVALDIEAKHNPDFFGELDEETYKERLWNHRPITDFWRVGPGTARRLAELGIHTMGQLALAPQEPIYDAIGKDAEILIDHAWGQEPCTIADIKAYRAKNHMLTSAQVFGCDNSFKDARLVTKEMIDDLSQRLVAEGWLAGGVSVWAGYALSDDERRALRATGDARLRGGPSGSATERLLSPTSSLSELRAAGMRAWDRGIARDRLIHRIGVSFVDVVEEGAAGIQADLFSNTESRQEEHSRQETINAIRERFGANALLRGTDLMPKATARERHGQIGGHRSGDE